MKFFELRNELPHDARGFRRRSRETSDAQQPRSQDFRQAWKVQKTREFGEFGFSAMMFDGGSAGNG